MSTISIDLESLGLTLVKGVSYTIELDEGFVKAAGSGIANAENTLVSFVAEGPKPSSTVLDNDAYTVTTTWNVKLSGLGTGDGVDLYFESGYIDSGYFGDTLPSVDLYKDDSTFVKNYLIEKTGDYTTRITIPVVDLNPGQGYYITFEEDSVIDTVNIGNDINTDENTSFTTLTEAAGFPSLSGDFSTVSGFTVSTNYESNSNSATIGTTASLTCDTAIIPLDATMNTSTTVTCDAVRYREADETYASVNTVDCTAAKLAYGDSYPRVDFGLTCDAYRIAKNTELTADVTGSVEYGILLSNIPGQTTIDWGDGTVETGTNGRNTHTYTSSGTYTVVIEGPAQTIRIGQTTEYIGSTPLPVKSAFIGENVTNIQFTACPITYAGDVLPASITSMVGMFRGCSDFNQDISYWDTSNVTNMAQCFRSASSFNQDIGDWDTSSVTSMSEMFRYAQDFNQDIGAWDTSNVQSFTQMFNTFSSGGSDFNNGGSSSINNWDTSSALYMREMFMDAHSFNQPLGNWDTSNVVSGLSGMYRMFYDAVIFDQDISDWCVENITSKPSGFDTGTPITWTLAEKPNWGAACS